MTRDDDGRKRPPHWLAGVDVTKLVAIMALLLSAISFYRSYIYTKQQLDVTVTEVSYATNQGGLYMTVALSNSGNRDAALLRVEPALWSQRTGAEPQWVALNDKVHADIPLATPKPPLIVKAGGVEIVTLSTQLNPLDAERALVSSEGGSFLGLRVATMNSDGNLYLLEHPVARLVIDSRGRIQSAQAAIHQTLSGFEDLQGAPPGDTLQSNKRTPFVWAEEQY
jgi:hypothetical protein